MVKPVGDYLLAWSCLYKLSHAPKPSNKQGNVAPFVKIRPKGKLPSIGSSLLYNCSILFQSPMWPLVPNLFRKNVEQSRKTKTLLKWSQVNFGYPNVLETTGHPPKFSVSHLLPLFSFLTSSDDRLMSFSQVHWRSRIEGRAKGRTFGYSFNGLIEEF